MPDDLLKMFLHDGLWAVACAMVFWVYHQANERYAKQSNELMKEIAVSQIRHAEAMTALTVAVTALHAMLTEMLRESRRI